MPKAIHYSVFVCRYAQWTLRDIITFFVFFLDDKLLYVYHLASMAKLNSECDSRSLEYCQDRASFMHVSRVHLIKLINFENVKQTGWNLSDLPISVN